MHGRQALEAEQPSGRYREITKQKVVGASAGPYPQAAGPWHNNADNAVEPAIGYCITCGGDQYSCACLAGTSPAVPSVSPQPTTAEVEPAAGVPAPLTTSEGKRGVGSSPSSEGEDAERRHREMVDSIHNELLQRSEASRGEGFYERQALIKIERGRRDKGQIGPMRIAVAPPDPAVPRRAELIAALDWSPDWVRVGEVNGGVRFEYIGIRDLRGKDYDFDALLERYHRKGSK